jgi:hypothetical protein
MKERIRDTLLDTTVSPERRVLKVWVYTPTHTTSLKVMKAPNSDSLL